GAAAQIWPLILVLVITSAIGLFYYLRVVTALYQAPSEAVQAPEPAPRIAPAVSLVLVVLTVLLFWFGCYPSPILRVIQSAIGNPV
ncbi:MAG TPA: hypothetical protein VN579_08835, partial [Bryobacteraceae bacterium]|nr:hypothetical protein [Bryobacteraceae bacterium]